MMGTWGRVILAGAAFAAPGSVGQGDWRTHGGDPAHRQYSALSQINTTNVQRLRVAWTYRTGDAGERSEIQCQPIVVSGVLYATTPQLKVVALDAATGRPLWTFNPFADSQPHPLGVNRGVVYWEEGGDKRILFTAGQRLIALDARTGIPVPAFGSKGSVDLREGLDRDVSKLYVLSNTPGAIYRDALILGTRVSEGPGLSAPGHVRAYDVRTGRIRWIFHTIPHAGEFGYDTWPKDAWQRVGGANAWSGISVDAERGLVFLPTGSAAFDFWGGDRVGANLFANCVLVLKAATGERVWHYQTIRHDVWDRDLPAAPILVTITREGNKVDAVAQVTKSGFVFLFDRLTGDPLFPIEEVAVPPSDLEGEVVWPTQPLPVKPPPFARQLFTEAEATDISPSARAAVLERLKQVRTGNRFMPPSKQGTVIFPGFDGGAEWGGAAFDPETGKLYVNANEMPWILTMVDVRASSGTGNDAGGRVYRQHCASCHGVEGRGAREQNVPAIDDIPSRWSKSQIKQLLEKGKGVMPSFAYLSDPDEDALLALLFGETPPAETAEDEKPAGTPYTHTGYNRFLDPEGYPAVKPPWGTLNSIDLGRGEIDWHVPLGEFPELTRRGIPPTGTQNYGGPVVTAGGLVFIGASQDKKFRAFDKKTGKILWETELPAGGYASPATYEVKGKQYVVIAAGGGKMNTPSGDAYVAFSLPD